MRQVSTLHATTWPALRPSDNSTFVLLHGWGCDSSDWDPIVGPLRQSGDVVTIDLPGSGKSAEAPGPYDLPGFASAVVDVLRARQVETPVLVGHSAGCEVAVALAESPLVKARAIVAVDPAYGFADDDRGRIRAVAERLEVESPHAVAVDYFSAIDGGTTPDHVREQHPFRIKATPRAMRESFREFAFGPEAFHFNPECEQRHRRRTVPLLAFYRNPTRATGSHAFATLPQDEVVVRSDAGHWLHLEDPERFVADTTRWLRTHAL